MKRLFNHRYDHLALSTIWLFITSLSSFAQLEANPADDIFSAAKLALSQAQSAKSKEKANIEYAGAEVWLNKFLKSFPNDPKAAEATYLLAVAQTQQGKNTKALQAYQKFISFQKPGKMLGMSSLQLALHDYKGKEYESALVHFNRAIEHLPDGNSKTLSHYSRALTLQNLPNTTQDAVTDLKYVISQENGKLYHEHSQYLVAQAFLEAKNYEEAFSLFRLTCTSKNPGIQTQSILKTALLAQKLDKPTEANKYHALILKNKELSEHHTSSALYLMVNAAKKKDWEKIVQLISYGEKELTKEEKVKRNYLVGQSYLNLGQQTQATPFLNKVIIEGKGTNFAFEAEYAQLSNTPIEKLDREKASTFVLTYKTTHPADLRLENIKLLIAESDFSTQKYSQAIQSYNAINLNLLDEQNLPTVAHRLIQSHLKLGQTQQAQPMIQHFISSYPKDPRTPYLLYEQAIKQAENGDNEKAIKTLTQLIKAPSSSKDIVQPAELILAQLLLKANNYKDSETLYAKIYKEHKGTKTQNSEWLFWLAYSQYNLKKNQEAYKNFLSSRRLDTQLNSQERSKHIAFCAYNLENVDALQGELDFYQKQFKELLPSTLYLYVALENYKKSDYKKSWWSFQRVVKLEDKNTYTPLEVPILEAYVKVAIENKEYAASQHISTHLKTVELVPYNKALNLYYSALSQYKNQQKPELTKTAQEDILEAMRINPGGDLKYQVLNIAGQIDIDLGEVANGTRLLKQVILLSPENQDHLKIEALNKLITHTTNHPSPENQKLREEYKKELEKLK